MEDSFLIINLKHVLSSRLVNAVQLKQIMKLLNKPND